MNQFLSLIFMILFSVDAYSQKFETEPENKEHENQIHQFQIYKEFLNKISGMLHYTYLSKYRDLKKEGVSVIELCDFILKNDAHSIYWSDALFLKASHIYIQGSSIDDLYSSFILELSYHINRKTNTLDYFVLESKANALNLLQSLVTSEHFAQPVDVELICHEVDELMEKGDLIDPSFWVQEFQLEDVTTIPEEVRTDLQERLLKLPEQAARMCLYLFMNLYYKTGYSKYTEILVRAEKSNDPHIQAMLKFVNSLDYKSNWESGKFDLFDFTKRF